MRYRDGLNEFVRDGRQLIGKAATLGFTEMPAGFQA